MNRHGTLHFKGAKVVVIDDDRFAAETVAELAADAELAPTIISAEDGPFARMEQLLDRILQEGYDAAICDHRLADKAFASFTGARLIAELYRKQVPGLLLSTFAALDSNTTIRRHRAHIPCLLNRNELDPARILQGLRLCADEIKNGKVVPERRKWRTLVRVASIACMDQGHVVDAVIHTWDPDHGVRFPLDLVEDRDIQQAVQDACAEGGPGEIRLFAQVNVDCRHERDLFFQEFEMAPEPNIHDLITPERGYST